MFPPFGSWAAIKAWTQMRCSALCPYFRCLQRLAEGGLNTPLCPGLTPEPGPTVGAGAPTSLSPLIPWLHTPLCYNYTLHPCMQHKLQQIGAEFIEEKSKGCFSDLLVCCDFLPSSSACSRLLHLHAVYTHPLLPPVNNSPS